MNWQFPYVVIDQNQLRHPHLIADVLDRCHAKSLQILVPDGAFLEFAKRGEFFETAHRSLQLLAPHRTLICASRKLSLMLHEELECSEPVKYLVHHESTEFLRTLLAEVEKGDNTTLHRLAHGPVTELMPPALDVWNNHERHKELLTQLCKNIKSELSTEELSALRRSPRDSVPMWLCSASGSRYVFQGLKARGANDTTAYSLTQSASVNAGFLSTMTCLAVDWIAYGGIESAPAQILSNDLHDVEYIVLGALSDSLASSDKRATRVCTAVAKAFHQRYALPQIAP